MNRTEQEAKRYYENNGWKVLNSGWPDFLLYRRRPDGTMEVKASEIKNTDDLRDNQRELLDVLSMVIPTVVAREKRPLPHRHKTAADYASCRSLCSAHVCVGVSLPGEWEFSESPIIASETEMERYERLRAEHNTAEELRQWESYQEWERSHGC
jgi:hypothetical protein